MQYRINRNLILQKLDEKLVGFDVERSFLYTFNETAEYIYKKIKSGWEEDKIANHLARKYDVQLPTVKKDIKVLISDLLKNKILLKSTVKKLK
jgi:hypothetical protein